MHIFRPHQGHARLRERGHNTVLDTTSLVHESYLRFVGSGKLRADDRRAFFAYASQVMRSVIVDGMRDRLAAKRGGDCVGVTLSTDLAANIISDEHTVLRVHEALEVLEQADSRLAQVALMRRAASSSGGTSSSSRLISAICATDNPIRGLAVCRPSDCRVGGHPGVLRH
jgi:DNA-directed RNA polymerase specialized sigma24 family protein